MPFFLAAACIALPANGDTGASPAAPEEDKLMEWIVLEPIFYIGTKRNNYVNVNQENFGVGAALRSSLSAGHISI